MLPRIQALLNNLTSSTTSKAPNEITYGFKLNRPLDLIAATERLSQQHKLARIDTTNAISFAQIHQKYHYDRRHQPIYIKKDNEAYLRLHKDYSIPTANAKFNQQYIKPFHILNRIDKQAYRLDIPSHWRVHPIFSLAQLKLAPPGSDPFKRPIPEHPGSIFVEGDTNELKSYVIKRILNKRIRRAGRSGKKEIIKYLIKWRDYNPKYDT